MEKVIMRLSISIVVVQEMDKITIYCNRSGTIWVMMIGIKS